MDIDWTLTGIAIAACLALTVFAGWKSGRPRKDSLNMRWVSWPLITVLAGCALVFAIVHAINLLGINTGDNFRHRLGY
jgi:hypothetical protein